MPDQLKNIVTVAAAAPGLTTIAHDLNINGVGVVPDKIETLTSGSFSVAADDTNLLITNKGGAADISVLVEHWHTYERALGPGVTALTPQPFQAGEGDGSDPGVNDVTFSDDGSTTDVYVDGVNGSDDNDGISTATALQTIAAVYRKFPQHVYQGQGGIRVNLAGVGGFGASATAQLDYEATTVLVGGEAGAWEGNSYVIVGPEMVPITPTTGPATAALDVVPAVAVAGGSPSAGGTLSTRFDFTAAAPGWTVDDFHGAFLRITRGGVKVIYEAPIAKNTADTITIRVSNVAPLILATDTAEIVEPGARFVNSADIFNGVAVSGRGTNEEFAQLLGASFQRIAFSSAYIRQTSGVSFDRCSLGDKGVDGAYCEDCAVDFANCYTPRIFAWGLGFAPWDTYPTPNSGADPIPANRTRIMALQISSSNPVLDLSGIGKPSTWINKFGLGIDGGGSGTLTIAYQALFLCLSPGGGYPIGIVQGELAGAGTVVDMFDGGRASFFSNSTPGRTSLYHVGGGNPLNLAESGVSIDYGTGVGDWEEVAGYAGMFWIAPAAGSFSDPTSYIRTA